MYIRCFLFQLEKLISKDPFLHHLAKEAFKNYVRAYDSHHLKQVFDIQTLDLAKVAKSFGFIVPPTDLSKFFNLIIEVSILEIYILVSILEIYILSILEVYISCIMETHILSWSKNTKVFSNKFIYNFLNSQVFQILSIFEFLSIIYIQGKNLFNLHLSLYLVLISELI